MTLIRGGRIIPGMRAAIFDMDGLLIDSEPLWRRAEQAAFRQVGVELDDATCRQTMGWRADEVVTHWYERFRWQDATPEEVLADMQARVIRLITTEGEALPGAREAVETLRSLGYSLGLASSSPPVVIEAVLRTLGLTGFFDVVCSAVDEARGKPDPAVFLRAAERLGVAPQACVAFEDSLAGVTAALAAGMRVIAVPAADQAGEPGFADAHVVLRSLEAFHPGLVDPE
jgi:mannitol-1-/sugar-/sorbitol-6-/2-deoxyglucose-6-phosphatase